MSWITSSTGAQYTARVAITCDTTGATPGGAAVVARVTIGPDFEDFWNLVQSNGYDIRLADGGGSLIPHERATWTYASKIAILDFEVTLPATAPSGAMRVVYLYYAPTATSVADPSAGPFAHTVTASAEPLRVMPVGRTIVWTAIAANESAASLTPTPVQTVVAIVGERRHFVTEPLRGMTYGVGYSYNGSTSFEDVDWVMVAVEDDAAAALTNWALPGNLRAFTDDSGTTIRGIFSPDSNEDGMATLRIGWNSYAAEDWRVLTIRAIGPQI